MNLDAKVLNKILTAILLLNVAIHLKDHWHNQVGFIPGLSICKSIIVEHQINKMKGKNHMIILIETGKAFDKIHPFMLITLNGVSVERL